MKILLIEDSPKLRKSLNAGLRRLGYAVGTAADGEEGIAFATTGNYDVLAVALSVARAIRRGLQPLIQIKNEISQISPQTLDRRITTEAQPR